MKSAYPKAADVQFLYRTTGLIDPTIDPFTSIDWDGAIASAVAEFEGKIGRTFNSSVQTRIYDPPQNTKSLLPLGYDLAAVTAITFTNRTLVNGVDYYLGPVNADVDGKPWQWIEFVALFADPIYQRRSISITGTWGYLPLAGGFIQIPDDAWHAILKTAAKSIAPEIELNINRGRLVAKTEDFQYSFAPNGPLKATMESWSSQINQAATRYRRVQVF